MIALQTEIIGKCGDANPNGNVALTYKGGCMKDVIVKDGYRCTGCGGWFHKECIFKHFALEKNHDWGRQQEREKIRKALENLLDEKRAKELSKNLQLYGGSTMCKVCGTDPIRQRKMILDCISERKEDENNGTITK